MIRGLVLGASGQIGSEIMLRGANSGYELVGTSFPQTDIGDRQVILEEIKRVNPQVVINVAAFTAVDRAEAEREQAFRINAEGARNVALGAQAVGARLIHLSTDYVYDGTGSTPILEDQVTNPLSVYGASKLAGDQAVADVWGPHSLIVRTSSVHGRYGVNFVHTMLKLFGEREELKIVSDQTMSPTWAGWLAGVVLELGQKQNSGVVHAAGAGAVTWLEFTQKILELVKPAKSPRLIPVKLAQWPAQAKRPKYSVLDCSKLAKLLNRPAPPWEHGLESHLTEIGALKELRF